MVISIYGLAVDPAQAQQQIGTILGLLPDQVDELMSEAMLHIASRPSEKLGLSLAISLLLGLWSANKGTKALFDGLNVAYNEKDSRNFFVRNGLTLGFTFLAVVAGIIAVALITVIPAITGTVGLNETLASALSWTRWPLAAVICVGVLGIAYKIGPDRDQPKRGWFSIGSFVAATLWLAGSALFSFYAENFGSFDKTYGSFAAVALMMLWLFLSSFSILLGGEINSELEKRKARRIQADDRPPNQ